MDRYFVMMCTFTTLSAPIGGRMGIVCTIWYAYLVWDLIRIVRNGGKESTYRVNLLWNLGTVVLTGGLVLAAFMSSPGSFLHYLTGIFADHFNSIMYYFFFWTLIQRRWVSWMAARLGRMAGRIDESPA